MRIKKHWLDRIAEDAKTCNVKMPWERGLRRKAMIRRREALDALHIKQSVVAAA